MVSTHIDTKYNQAYRITAGRFYGGDNRGVMVNFEIGAGGEFHCIALHKKDAVDFCLNILKSLNELEK